MMRAMSFVSIQIISSLLAAAAADVPAAVSPAVTRFVGARAADTLAGATRVEVFRVSAQRAQEGAKGVGGYRIVTTGPEQGEAFARRLSAVLLDEKTYRFDTSKVGGFVPMVGLRAWKGDRWVEVLLSFANDELVVLSPTAKGDAVRSAQEDFDNARATLVELAKAALPGDKEVQALAEKK